MANGAENTYAAQLQQARQEDLARQSRNEEINRLEAKKHKISPMQAVLLLAVALIADGASFLLAVFIITAPLAWVLWVYAVLGFYIWLKNLGISWSEAKGMRTLTLFAAACGIEFIPLLSALPAWTAFVVGAIINDRVAEVVDKLPVPETIKNAAEKVV